MQQLKYLQRVYCIKYAAVIYSPPNKQNKLWRNPFKSQQRFDLSDETVLFTSLLYSFLSDISGASQVALVVNNPPANAGDMGSNPWVGKIPWRRAWQPTPAFSPGESLVRGAWWLQRVNSQTQTRLSTFIHSFNLIFGEGNGNPLQYPCLENPVEGGAW